MQEKPAWVSRIEEERRQAGQNTVSREHSDRYQSGNNEPYVPSGGASSGGGSSSGSSFVVSVPAASAPASTGPTGYAAADPSGVDNYHARNTANKGQGMTAFDLAALKGYGEAWNDADAKQKQAQAAGNTELASYYQGLKDQAHRDAETLRNSYGYYGGDDGSQYIPMEQERVPEQVQLPEIPQSAPAQSSGYDLTQYLKQASAAQIEAALAGLKGAYEQAAAGYDAKLELLPQTYSAARNSAAAQNALARQAFDERAAASGLSSGAAAQADLSRSSAYLRELADTDREQANANSQLQLAKANLQSEYEAAKAAARAQGSAALAQDLYQELIRAQLLDREDALLHREDALLAADRAAQELELALKYGVELYPAAGGTASVPAQSGSGRGYDNGSLTAQQVKTMQAHYGLEADGMWGPNSRSTTGMDAETAWKRYLYEITAARSDSSAYWSAASGYNRLLNDLTDRARRGESPSALEAVIAAAQQAGQITAAQARQLRERCGLAQ